VVLVIMPVSIHPSTHTYTVRGGDVLRLHPQGEHGVT
jgi:hypothetical protein